MTSEDLNLVASAARARVEQHRLEREREAALRRVRAGQNLTAAWKPLSSSFLSAKAKLQPRDSKGRWIEMGSMVRWAMGSQIGGKKKFAHGRVMGFDEKTKKYSIKPNTGGKNVELEGKQLEVIQATIPDSPAEAKKGLLGRDVIKDRLGQKVKVGDWVTVDHPERGPLGGAVTAGPDENGEVEFRVGHGGDDKIRIKPNMLTKPTDKGRQRQEDESALRRHERDSKDLTDAENWSIEQLQSELVNLSESHLPDPGFQEILDRKMQEREENDFEGDDVAFDPDDDQPDFDPEEMTDDRRAALDDDDDQPDFEPDASATRAADIPRHSVISIDGKKITVDAVVNNGDGTVDIAGFDRTDEDSWDRFKMWRYKRDADDPIDVLEVGDNDAVPEGYTHAKDLQPGDVYTVNWPDSGEVRTQYRVKSVTPGEPDKYGRTWTAEVEDVNTGKMEKDFFGDGMGAAVKKVNADGETSAPDAPTPTQAGPPDPRPETQPVTPAPDLEDTTRGDILRFDENPFPGEDIDVKYDTGLVHQVKDGRAWVTFGDVGGWVPLGEGVSKDGHFDFGDDGESDSRKALAKRAGLSDEEMADAPEFLPATEDLRSLVETEDFMSPADLDSFHDYLDEVQVAPGARSPEQWDSIQQFVDDRRDSLNDDQYNYVSESIAKARKESLDGPGTDTIDSMEKAMDAPDNGPGQVTVPAEWAKEKQFDDALGRLKPLTEAEKARTEGDLENNRRAKEAWDADPANFPELPGPLALGDRVSVDGRAGTIIGGRPDGERYVMVGDDGEKFGAHPDEIAVTQSMSDAIDELNATPAGNVTEFAKNMFQNLHPDANWDEADQTAWLDAAKKAMENPND